MFIVSGLSGSGKTTLCGELGRMLGITPVRTSDFLISLLAETRSKDERLSAWHNRSDTALSSTEKRLFRLADQLHWHVVQQRPIGVHESMTLPLLLRRSHSACRVYLDVATTVRHLRVAHRHRISLSEAGLLATRKDAQTIGYIESAYGLTPGTPEHLSLYDIVVIVAEDGMTQLQAPRASTTDLQLLTAALTRTQEQEV